MYQPLSRNPSLVVNCTSSYAVPRSAAGTWARAAWVTTYAIATGKRTETARKRVPSSQEQPPRIAPPEAVVAPPRRPERDDAETEKREPGEDRQETREVVSRGAGRQRVVHRLGAGEDAEEGCDEGDGRARAGAKTAVEDACGSEEGERNEAAEDVVGGGCPGVRLQEVVVDDVKCDDADRETRERRPRSEPAPRCESRRSGRESVPA